MSHPNDLFLELLNRFHATGLFIYPLKTSENLCFFCFQEFRRIPVVLNGLFVTDADNHDRCFHFYSKYNSRMFLI